MFCGVVASWKSESKCKRLLWTEYWYSKLFRLLYLALWLLYHSISHRINFKLATLTYKMQSTSQPTHLHHLIPRQFTGSSVSLRSSQRPLLQVPRTRAAYGSRAFSVAVPNIMDRINYPPILAANSLNVLRRRRKTHLFIASASVF